MPPVSVRSSGPKWSTKHQPPISEVRRAGKVRWTVIPRGPPRGTSRASSSTKSSKSLMAGSLGGLRPRHGRRGARAQQRSEEHTSELQSRGHLVCRLLLEKKKTQQRTTRQHTTET